MGAVLADTHTAIWMLTNPAQLSKTALATLEATLEQGNAIYISAITLVEIIYLIEKNRLGEAAYERVIEAVTQSGGELTLAPLTLNVAQSLRIVPRSAVPDMPDRIIAATALHLGLPLVTRDEKIRAANILTIW